MQILIFSKTDIKCICLVNKRIKFLIHARLQFSSVLEGFAWQRHICHMKYYWKLNFSFMTPIETNLMCTNIILYRCYMFRRHLFMFRELYTKIYNFAKI